jgi:deoxycytidylate deaminase
MTNVDYPYMPNGRALKYVSAGNAFMQEAGRARIECAGDSLYPVGGVLVQDGKVIARAGNGFDRGPGKVHICPRIVLDCPSGTGYELCNLHDSIGHAEPMTIAAAHEAGESVEGADFYMYGHWWVCKPCWDAMIDAGVRDVYVTDDAHERFSRARVYGETLKPSISTVALEGFDEATRLALLDEIKNFDLRIALANADVRCVSHPDGIDCYLRGADEPIYSITSCELSMARQLANVLKQL